MNVRIKHFRNVLWAMYNINEHHWFIKVCYCYCPNESLEWFTDCIKRQREHEFDLAVWMTEGHLRVTWGSWSSAHLTWKTPGHRRSPETHQIKTIMVYYEPMHHLHTDKASAVPESSLIWGYMNIHIRTSQTVHLFFPHSSSGYCWSSCFGAALWPSSVRMLINHG